MVKIVADSTCDLSKDLIEKYEISILPLHILLGDEEYEDIFMMWKKNSGNSALQSFLRYF